MRASAALSGVACCCASKGMDMAARIKVAGIAAATVFNVFIVLTPSRFVFFTSAGFLSGGLKPPEIVTIFRRQSYYCETWLAGITKIDI